MARTFIDEITRGQDGNLWLTERFGNKVGRISPEGSVTEIDPRN